MTLTADDLINWALLALAWIIGWLQRNAKSRRRWRLIREQAAAELADPRGTNDPATAIVKATIAVNKPRILTETMRLQPVVGERRVSARARTPRAESNEDGHGGSHET